MGIVIREAKLCVFKGFTLEVRDIQDGAVLKEVVLQRGVQVIQAVRGQECLAVLVRDTNKKLDVISL
jgi:hypothetical protein